MRIGRWLFILLCVNLSCSVGRTEPTDTVSSHLTFRGSCDASAAIAISDDSFLVADDENNTLRLYRVADNSMPIRTFSLTVFLGIESENPEADIEGATRTGDRIYWITSHGRNKDGKMRPNRYRFFAADIVVKDNDLALRPVGKPCATLVHSLVNTSLGSQLGLDKATQFDKDLKKKDRERLAPKDDGLNIEALAASADGETLYIGFRNPLFALAASKRAIVIPLENAKEVLEHSAVPKFGKAMLWDLEGRGVRSIEYCPRQKVFLLIAGDPDEGGQFALYRWSGDPADSPVLQSPIRSGLDTFKPEALIPFANRDEVLLLSDDGAIDVKVTGPDDCIDPDAYNETDHTCEQKYLSDSARKTFRAIRVVP